MTNAEKLAAVVRLRAALIRTPLAEAARKAHERVVAKIAREARR